MLSPRYVHAPDFGASPPLATFAAASPRRLAIIDLAIPVLGCFTAIMFFAATDSYTRHWFLLPVFLCGVSIAPDSIRWLRGSIDIFDVRALISVIGIHFFFLAPILHTYWRGDITDLITPPDWRPWLGGMAILNWFGILAYLYFSRLPTGSWTYARSSFRATVPGRAVIVMPAFFLASVLALAYYIAAHGGLQSLFVKGAMDTRYASTGLLGMIMALAYSTPVLGAMTVTFLRISAQGRRQVNSAVVAFALLPFLPLPFLVGGHQGARSAILYVLFWIGGMFHFFWRRANRTVVVTAMIAAVALMYTWTIFKKGGVDNITRLRQGQTLGEVTHRSSISTQGMLLGDLSRTDIQALFLSRLIGKDNSYRYRWGTTYFTGVFTYIPRFIWPSKPTVTRRIAAGVEMQLGSTSVTEKSKQTRGAAGNAMTRVYGLAGEAMLNFSYVSIPFAFALWGYLVRRCRLLLYQSQQGDAVLLFLPFFTYVCAMMLYMDSDNIIANLILRGMFPAIAWLLVTRRIPMSTFVHSECPH